MDIEDAYPLRFASHESCIQHAITEPSRVDYFAGLAMQALIARGRELPSHETTATIAVEFAVSLDEKLKQLEGERC